jgi:hypothetical protein
MQEATQRDPFPLIGLTGRARVGKDTVAKFLADEAMYKAISFAEPMRVFVCEIAGIPREQLDEVKDSVIPWLGKSPRQMLQSLGTEWGREMVKQSIWIDVCMARASQLKRAVVTDVRFDDEAQAIHARGGKIVKVIRPDALEVSSHISEMGISPWLVDDTIINDGSMRDLQRKVCGLTHRYWLERNQ